MLPRWLRLESISFVSFRAFSAIFSSPVCMAGLFLSLNKGPSPPFAWSPCFPQKAQLPLTASPCSRLSLLHPTTKERIEFNDGSGLSDYQRGCTLPGFGREIFNPQKQIEKLQRLKKQAQMLGFELVPQTA